MIKSLQSLRLVFALMIFLHHFPMGDSVVFRAGGSAGVSFFLMLSGFVMSLGYGKKIKSADFYFKNYILKRIFRLWPLHLLCLLVAILIFYRDNPFALWQIPVFTFNATMLQSWVPLGGVFFSGNSVSWCLADLMLCYALMPAIYRFNLRHSLYTIVSVITLGMIIIALAALFLPENFVKPILYISPVFRIFDFYIGMVLYIFYGIVKKKFGNQLKRISTIQKTFIETCVVLVLSMSVCLYYCTTIRIYASILWWIPMSLLIITFSLSECYRGGVRSKNP